MTAALALVVGMLAAAQVQTVSRVDLDRYLGQWHEVARYPNRFQKSCASDVVATYSRRDDGRIRVVNRCRESDGKVKDAEGVARVVDAASNAITKADENAFVQGFVLNFAR